nr:unnamed protein product [Callosobruchus analis]
MKKLGAAVVAAGGVGDVAKSAVSGDVNCFAAVVVGGDVDLLAESSGVGDVAQEKGSTVSTGQEWQYTTTKRREIQRSYGANRTRYSKFSLKKLEVIYMNIQSIRNKFDEIQCFVINNPCDVLVLRETWLSDVEASFYNLNGYKAVHACRQKRGGGVTFHLKEGIYFQEIGKSKYDDLFNHLTIVIGFNSLKLTAVYKPPSYSVDDFLNNFENLLIAHPQNHIIIGDCNVDLIDSNNNTLKNNPFLSLALRLVCKG